MPNTKHQTTPVPLLVEQRDAVLLMTFNRPEARNAINLALARALDAALDRLDSDQTLSVGVLTGAGKGFSAGMDLKAFAAGERPSTDTRGFAGIAQKPPRKPLIAAVEGFAVAGGLEVALACDLIISSRDARFGIPESTRSLVASGGALLRLPRRVSHGAAMELALTGDLIDAKRAYEIGLVDQLTDPGSALSTAFQMAERISKNGPLALIASKQVLVSSGDWSSDQFWQKQRAITEPVTASQDAREGALAFTEKRTPRWRGE